MIELIGHFHPLLVHLPIGILILAMVFSLLPASTRGTMQPAFNLALLVAAISAVAACIAGYILSNSGDYDETLARNHQWLGIATCICIIATWLTRKYQRQALWLTVIVMAIASHMGGTLTHGEGYLFKSKEVAQAADSITATSDSLVSEVRDTASTTSAPRQVFMYRDEITPILKNKCYNCHSAVKKKGGLRLDSEAFINKGGKNGDVLVSGNPNKSPLYTHLLLPLEDDKHMPPKGKKQLSSQEIALIHRWISKGAPFGAIEILPTAQAPVPEIPALPDPITKPDEADAEPAVQRSTDANIPAADEQAVRALQAQGIIVEKISDGSNAVSVNFVNVKELDDTDLRELNGVKQQVSTLKLTGLPMNDQMMKALPAFPNLRKIQLEKTGIGDEGLAELRKFPNLEVVNLYGTRITDNGLKHLESTNIKKINLWNTGVTPKGIEALMAKNPKLEVEAGQLSLKKVDSTSKK